MGEIADSMIYGEACEMCGVPLDGEAPGFPRYCSRQCAKDRGADYNPGAGKQRQTVNRNFVLKIHYNGELIYSFKDIIERSPEMREEVMKLAEIMHEDFNQDPDPEAKFGGSLMTWLKQKKGDKDGR